MDMDISKHVFTSEEISKLIEYRINQPDVRLKDRFLALLLLAKGIELPIITGIVHKSTKTIKNWFHQYISKGINSLNSFNYKPKLPYLAPKQIIDVVTWVKKNNPAKTKEIAVYIKKKFNVKYSNEGVRVLIKNNGLTILKPKVIPGKAPNEEEQKEFIEKYFEMKISYQPGTVFLFGDGMHLIHQNIPGYCWGDPKDPPILPTNTGRKRLNILGAYNPDTHSLVHLTGEENCNAKQVIEFFEVIIKVYHKAPKIVIILDNATYFKAKSVRKWLKKNPLLEIEFLPPYAPNLNLIERFWRFVKEHLVRNTYYEKYKTFRAKVFQFLNHVDKHIDELKTLMVEKFQIVKNKQTMCQEKP